jgi:hypothetical protein
MDAVETTADKPSTRRQFAANLAKTLALGLGVSLFSAKAARAAESHCCRTGCSPGGLGCGYYGLVGYTCTGGCVTCCACFSPNTNQCVDFSGGCVC